MSRSSITLSAGLLGFGGASLVLLLWFVQYYGDLSRLSDIDLARRLVRYHHVPCTIERASLRDGTLSVSCTAGGSTVFHAALPCESGFACETLEFDAECWHE